jgi:hypothetical protein
VNKKLEPVESATFHLTEEEARRMLAADILAAAETLTFNVLPEGWQEAEHDVSIMFETRVGGCACGKSAPCPVQGVTAWASYSLAKPYARSSLSTISQAISDGCSSAAAEVVVAAVQALQLVVPDERWLAVANGTSSTQKVSVQTMIQKV